MVREARSAVEGHPQCVADEIGDLRFLGLARTGDIQRLGLMLVEKPE
jgi:hypothetical protein